MVLWPRFPRMIARHRLETNVDFSPGLRTGTHSDSFVWACFCSTSVSRRLGCFLGVDDVVKTQPQTFRVPEEEQGEADGKAAPQDELLGKRKLDKTIKPKETCDHNDGSSAVINVDSAYKVPLLALKLQVTRGAGRIHREEAPEQGRGAAPWTPQAHASPNTPADSLNIYRHGELSSTTLTQGDSVGQINLKLAG